MTFRKVAWRHIGSVALRGTAVVLAVATIVTFIRGIHHIQPSPNAVVNGADLEPFLKHLQDLWDRYLDMVELLVTLLTGVIAVSAGMVKLGPREVVVDRSYFAAGMISLLVGMAAAVLWRIDSQLLMEAEMFGNPERTASLFSAHGIQHPFTSSYEYATSITVFGAAADALMILTATGLIVGLTLLARFAYSNLPDPTRPSSASR